MEHYSNDKLDSYRWRAISFSIELGRRVQLAYPDLAELSRVKSQRELAEMCQSNGFSFVEEAHIMKCAIGYALRGNSNPRFGETYDGLMAPKEYSELVKRRLAEGGRYSGFLMVSSGRSFADLSQEKMAENHRKSALARGCWVWEDADVWMAVLLAREPENRRGKRYLTEKVAEGLNRFVKKGKPCSGEMVKKMFARQRERLPGLDLTQGYSF